MAKSVKYLNYNVIRNDEIIASGTVPAVIAFSGSIKNYDLGGIWLSHRGPLTKIELSDEVKTIVIHSDRVKTEWLAYLEKINSGEVTDYR